MKRYFLAAAIAVSFSASADSEFRQGADYIRVSALPCKDEKTVAHITASGERASDYRQARADINGKAYEGCWKPDFSTQMIHLRYDDGDAGLLPFGALKPVREV